MKKSKQIKKMKKELLRRAALIEKLTEAIYSNEGETETHKRGAESLKKQINALESQIKVCETQHSYKNHVITYLQTEYNDLVKAMQ